MSKCVVHMMKMKSSALGGIQSHNQREHESRKNKDIDYSKSEYNYDVLEGNDSLNYKELVRNRINELDLKKAVRKDAVVYCSFLISSDKQFFYELGESAYKFDDYLEKQNKYMENFESLTPFEDCDKLYQEKYIRKASEIFFRKATDFFNQRYGEENLINATVHLDETTPHMHLGIVPVTTDGRLSAKAIFTPLELKQLQTDFAKEVGSYFNLERGLEGSTSKHLDELSFKVQKQQEKYSELSEKVYSLNNRKDKLEKDCDKLETQANDIVKTISSLRAEYTTLDTQKRFLEGTIAKLEHLKDEITLVINKLLSFGKDKGFSMEQIKGEIKKTKALEFIEKTGQTQAFDNFSKGSTQKGFSSPGKTRNDIDIDI